MILLAGRSSLSSALQLIGVLLIFVFVLVITWMTTKFIAGYQKVQTQGRNLKIIETQRLMNNKYLSIIKAGDKYLVVAIGKDEVRLLTVLTEEELVSGEEYTPAVKGQFQDALKEAFGKFKDSFPKKQA